MEMVVKLLVVAAGGGGVEGGWSVPIRVVWVAIVF